MKPHTQYISKKKKKLNKDISKTGAYISQKHSKQISKNNISKKKSQKE